MLVESALSLVFDKAKLTAKGVHGNAFEGVKDFNGGVLTGATAFGLVLVDRLNKYGEMRISVKDVQ